MCNGFGGGGRGIEYVVMHCSCLCVWVCVSVHARVHVCVRACACMCTCVHAWVCLWGGHSVLTSNMQGIIFCVEFVQPCPQRQSILIWFDKSPSLPSPHGLSYISTSYTHYIPLHTPQPRVCIPQQTYAATDREIDFIQVIICWKVVCLFVAWKRGACTEKVHMFCIVWYKYSFLTSCVFLSCLGSGICVSCFCLLLRRSKGGSLNVKVYVL